MESTLVDLSHVITDGMLTYPGLPTPQLGTVLSRESSRGRYAPGVEFHIGSIEMCTNTGTYLDTPAHRYEDGWDLSSLPLERCVDLRLVVVDLPADAGEAYGFTAADFDGLDVRGAAVIMRTGWARHWGTPKYFENTHPYLTAEGTAALVEGGAVLVGIDSLNIDGTAGSDRPAHSGLLGAGIPIVEHLTNLAALPADGARFTAVPIKVAGLGTFSVRAFATLRGRTKLTGVVFDCADVRALAAFWSAVMNEPADVRSDEWATVGDYRRGTVLAFQRVPEGKAVKNRVHVDIHSLDIPGDTERAVALGATALGEIVADDQGWFQVLQDPEGNEWCLVS
jgi:kynurenine formamidase/predicted enzyme related to lactoylglutathione lyase